ncbi:MAG: hypothetical protein QM840_05855, partial [Verrucomicrobiota bacterium]|nr:hypothetical protein [Verrucomicrobiota bacterium]
MEKPFRLLHLCPRIPYEHPHFRPSPPFPPTKWPCTRGVKGVPTGCTSGNVLYIRGASRVHPMFTGSYLLGMCWVWGGVWWWVVGP